MQHSDKAMRFLALGDSYTIGEGVSSEQRWPEQLTRRLRAANYRVADPEIIAATGWTTDELSAAIDRANPDGPYALVSLLIGVNDQFRGRSVDKYREELERLLQRAVALAGGDARRVLVLSIPDWGVTPFAADHQRDAAVVGREIDSFNQANREAAEAAGAQYIDVTAISRQAKEDRSLLGDDALHPSAAMYERWTEVIEPPARDILVESYPRTPK